MKKSSQKLFLKLQKTKIAKLNDHESRLIIGGNVNNSGESVNVDSTVPCFIRSSASCFIYTTTG